MATVKEGYSHPIVHALIKLGGYFLNLMCTSVKRKILPDGKYHEGRTKERFIVYLAEHYSWLQH
jgi:hypothetical protein